MLQEKQSGFEVIDSLFFPQEGHWLPCEEIM